MDNKLYEEILNNDGFLNDLFTELGATDKVSVLTEAGFDLEVEYKRWSEEFNAKHNEKLEL